MLTGWPVFAKEKKREKAMDPQQIYGSHGKEKEMKFLEIVYTRKP